MQETKSPQPAVQAQDKIITREPLSGSRKVYVSPESSVDLKVPMREISLTDGTSVTVYDASGPYTDVTADINVIFKRTLELLRPNPV